MTFFDPGKDPTGAGFQVNQSFLAFGSGGAFGVGLGEGQQKLFFLPEAHTDFVLALVGEELGLAGTAAIMALFGLLVLKGFQIAGRAREPFGRHLAHGITLLIGFQALINAGVATGLLPTKGLTLPLVSYGGSSLLVSLLAIGILLSISRDRQGGRQTGVYGRSATACRRSCLQRAAPAATCIRPWRSRGNFSGRIRRSGCSSSARRAESNRRCWRTRVSSWP
jgi:cell division protein FtsW